MLDTGDPAGVGVLIPPPIHTPPLPIPTPTPPPMVKAASLGSIWKTKRTVKRQLFSIILGWNTDLWLLGDLLICL
uniref:Leucine rich repeat family protein n=1 Tax=Rhizophora mucronata TaxID=61149 RepID=A0A2P2J329_RHIMU